MQPTTFNAPHLTQALFAGQEHHLAIQAAAAGEAAGQLFVEDGLAPRIAVLWVQHRVFVGGLPDTTANVAAVRDLLTSTIAPAARARGDYAFGLYYPPTWHDHLTKLLPSLPHTTLDRRYYMTDAPGLPAERRGALPAGLRAAAVDADLLAQTYLRNHAQLAEELCSERPTVEDFLARSFGVCLLDGDTLAGWCLSEYNCGARCEVGIEVVEAYRRRGLGTLMTQALCAEAARRGIQQVGWHCLTHNTASAATAARAGLRLVLDYPSAVVWLKQSDA